MKKNMLVFTICLIFSVISYAGTADTIDQMVKEKLEKIRNSKNKSGSFVTEIKIDKGKRNKKSEPVSNKYKIDIGNLAITNVFGGFFEGGVIGAGIGLIGYSHTKNRDINPLINGAVLGTVSGVALAALLSVVEAKTERYFASDEFGYGMILWPAAGAFLGASTGALIYLSTEDGSDILEGTGYGVVAGALAGIVIAAVQTFTVDKNNAYKNKGRASNIIRDLKVIQDGTTTLLTYGYNY